MLEFKAGVSIKRLVPQMLLALRVMEDLFNQYGLPTVITSGNDGQHMDGSKHYEGAALDFRSHHAPNLAKGIAQAAKSKLQILGFDVIFESPNLPNEHIHVEYDPK